MTPERFSTLAKSIASDIREYGHWQNGNSQRGTKCCVILNPTMISLGSKEQCAFLVELKNLLDISVVAQWSDNTETDELLATLESL